MGTLWDWAIGCTITILFIAVFILVILGLDKGMRSMGVTTYAEHYIQQCQKAGGNPVYNGRHYDCLK